MNAGRRSSLAGLRRGPSQLRAHGARWLLALRLGQLALFEWLAIALILVGQVRVLPDRIAFLRDDLLPVVRLWPDPALQQRTVVGPELYDLLVATDRLLSRESTILLVTSGVDTRHREYVAYHRALYHLAPRPVWWVAPATSERRPEWWIRSELRSEPLLAVARRVGADALLLYDGVSLPDLDHPVTALPGKSGLVQLRPNGGVLPRVAVPAGGASGALRLVLASVVLLLAGVILAPRIGPPRGPGSGLVKSALAWGLGAGMVTIALFWLDRLGVALVPGIVLLSAAIFAGALLASIARRPVETRGDASLIDTSRFLALAGWSPRELAMAFPLLVILAANALFVALVAVGRPLTIWDSWVTWGMKARIIFLEGHIAPGVYADLSRAVTHLDYPLLLPLLEAWFYAWLAAPDDRFAGVPAIFFYLALLALTLGALRHWGAGRLTALTITAALGAIPNLSGLAGLNFADVPLAFYAALALVSLLQWLEDGRLEGLAAAVLSGGLLAWTKREGLILLILLVLAAFLAIRLRNGRTRGGRRGLIAGVALALGGCLCAGPWLIFLAQHGVENTDFLPLSLTTLFTHLDRAVTIATIVAARMLDSQWAFLWVLVALTVAATGLPRCQAADLLLVIAGGYILTMSAAYLFSAMSPYQAHVLSSIDRLLAHVAPITVLWMARRWLEAKREACEGRPDRSRL